MHSELIHRSTTTTTSRRYHPTEQCSNSQFFQACFLPPAVLNNPQVVIVDQTVNIGTFKSRLKLL